MASRLLVTASSVALKQPDMELKSGYRQQLEELGAEQKRLVTRCKRRQKRSARLICRSSELPGLLQCHVSGRCIASQLRAVRVHVVGVLIAEPWHRTHTLPCLQLPER